MSRKYFLLFLLLQMLLINQLILQKHPNEGGLCPIIDFWCKLITGS